jgi:hypothetical protein
VSFCGAATSALARDAGLAPGCSAIQFLNAVPGESSGQVEGRTNTQSWRIQDAQAGDLLVAVAYGGQGPELAFATVPQTVVGNACSSAVTVQSLSDTGLPLESATGIDLTVSAPASSLFVDAARQYPLARLLIGAGTSSASFYFRGLSRCSFGSGHLRDGVQPEADPRLPRRGGQAVQFEDAFQALDGVRP